jgi:hypothetical protein
MSEHGVGNKITTVTQNVLLAKVDDKKNADLFLINRV